MSDSVRGMTSHRQKMFAEYIVDKGLVSIYTQRAQNSTRKVNPFKKKDKTYG